MQLTLSQQNAIDRLLTAVASGERIVSLSGPAGTGKTTIINALVVHLQDAVVCTPTNKAAQVLCSKGIYATTFYKRFYLLDEENRVPGQKLNFIPCRKICEQKSIDATGFADGWAYYEPHLPEGKRAFADIIVVDEASMLTTRQVREMSRMCRVLILVGDRHQLPPVGDRDNPAGYFATLRPTAELTEVMRQAEGSLILTLADEIRRGGSKVDRMLRDFLPPDDFEDWVRREARFIAYTNKERARINHVSRQILGYDKAYPMMGDRMIVTNNYNEDFLNGTEVTVLDFDWNGVTQLADICVQTESGDMLGTVLRMAPFIKDQVAALRDRLCEHWEEPTSVDEETRLEATFGYAITAHKAQGSEWGSVAVFDQRSLIAKIQGSDPRAAMSPEEYIRRWTYTAITRARKDLAFAPTWWAKATNLEAAA